MEEKRIMLDIRKRTKQLAAVLAVLAVVPLWGNPSLADEKHRIENGVIIVTGNGVPPEKGSPAQKRLMAKRAAQADAYRLLGEYVQGVQVDSQTVVKDFVAQSDDIKTKVSALIKGALLLATRNMSDGSVEVDVGMKLDDLYAAMPPAVKVDPPPPEPLAVEPAPAKAPTQFPMDIHIKRRNWNEEALAHNEKGIDMAIAGDLDAALAEYQQAANMDPNMDIAWSNMAEIYIQKKMLAEAVNAARKAISIDEKWSDNHYRLGVTLWVSGDKDGGITAEKKALDIKKDNDWALGALGEMYAALNQGDKAVEVMKKATQVKPGDPQLWYYLGLVYEDVKDMANARSAFQKAVDLATKMGIDFWEAKDKLAKI